MYAIVDIAGKQFKVEKDNFVYAPLLEGEEGTKVDFDQVLLVDNDGKVKVGAQEFMTSLRAGCGKLKLLLTVTSLRYSIFTFLWSASILVT